MGAEREKLVERLRGRSADGAGIFSLTVLFDLGMFFLLVVLLTVIFSPVVLRPLYLPQVGDIATRDIKADRDLLVEDAETTRKRRWEAATAAVPVYDWDPGMMDTVARRIGEHLKWLEEMRINAARVDRDRLRDAFSERLEDVVDEQAFAALLGVPDLATLTAEIAGWLSEHSQIRVVSGPEVLNDLAHNPFVIHAMGDEESRTTAGTGATGLMDLMGIRRVLEKSAEQKFIHLPDALRKWTLDQVGIYMRPTLVLNLAETKNRRDQASIAVDPVFYRLRRGQMVIQAGAEVTDAARLKIDALNQNRWTGKMAMNIMGLAMALLLFMWLGRKFLLITSAEFPKDRKTLYILGTILLVTSLLSSLTFTVGQGLAEIFGLSTRLALYLPLAALGSAMASLTIGARAGIPGGALMLGAILSFLCALESDGGLPIFLYFMVGSLVGGFTLRVCRKRYDVLIAGFWIGLAQALTVPAVELLSDHMPTWDWVLGASVALLSGMLTGLWGLALIPLFEFLFNITTDSRLLELASGDHPLLKSLSLRSPGTYHHSVMMGNLAEAAAESIHANPLMARVMALYHDVGKMSKPHYFVENQSGENRHDHLSPSMSVKVIQGHVKDGVDMVREYKLGSPILEAVTTHHGTSLLQYFHNRAVNQAAKRGEKISEGDFRYPGPRPQSKEGGILMLADSVEAAARTLKTPSPAQIQALVARIVASKIADGQLQECRLTLQEIARIEEAFTRVLTLGFYHRRIEYPDQIKRRMEGARHAGHGSAKPLLTSMARGG
ncbi:MAG: HDIG domain-containing protein [Magnetococcales bacterium]|nr:HDIG domain-containing protein [Magnetococcales bacterium]